MRESSIKAITCIMKLILLYSSVLCTLYPLQWETNVNSFPRGLDLFISGGSRIGFSYPIQQSRLYPWDHMAQVRRRINGRGQHDEHSGEGGVQGGVQRGWAPPIPPSIKYVMPHHKVDHGRTPYADFVQADCLKGSSREKAKQYTAHLRPSSTLLPPSLCTCIILTLH